MRTNIPAPIARARKTEEALAAYKGTGVLCLVAPFEFSLPGLPEEQFRENVLYAGRVQPEHVVESRCSMMRHFGIQAFVARPTSSGAWFYLPHARRTQAIPPGPTEFFMVHQPGVPSRGRDLAPRELTLTEAMGFCTFDAPALDRLGNRWFLKHLRRDAKPVPCPPEFSF